MIEEKVKEKLKVIPMQAGEFEVRKAFEETTVKNMKTVVAFSQETRNLTQELMVKIDHLSNMILTKDTEIKEIRGQLAGIQQKLYSQGS